jgi:hypothetical protein
MKTNPKEDIFLASGTKCNFEFKYRQTRPGSHRSIFPKKSLNKPYLLPVLWIRDIPGIGTDPDPRIRTTDLLIRILLFSSVWLSRC